MTRKFRVLDPRLRLRKFPMLDTGIGQEAGFKNDAELMQAAKEQRAHLEALLTPEALARLDAAEDEAMHRILFGTTHDPEVVVSKPNPSEEDPMESPEQQPQDPSQQPDPNAPDQQPDQPAQPAQPDPAQQQGEQQPAQPEGQPSQEQPPAQPEQNA